MWYYIRNIAIIVMVVILMYVIRILFNMALLHQPEDKQDIKKMMIAWLKHYQH